MLVITPPYGPTLDRLPVNVPETLLVVGAGAAGACVAGVVLAGAAVDCDGDVALFVGFFVGFFVGLDVAGVEVDVAGVDAVGVAAEVVTGVAAGVVPVPPISNAL